MIAWQAGTVEPATAQRVIQFAAVLLEMGGAVLIAGLFAVASRSSRRRVYFTTWLVAWGLLALAISAVAARYLLLSSVSAGTVPDGETPVRVLYWVYACAKLGYWVLVWRGVVEYVHPPATGTSRWRWLGAAVVVACVSFLFSNNLNDLLVWQTPFAVAACAAGAWLLVRLPRARRTEGVITTAAVLGATASVWLVYFVVFGDFIGLLPLSLDSLATPVLAYNSYVDMLLLVTLGCAMLMLFMEDARRRIADIELRLGSLVIGAPEPIITLDAQRRVAVANRAAIRVFGSGARLAPGAPVTDLVAEPSRLRFRAAIEEFADTEAGSRLVGEDGSLAAMRSDGSSFTAEFTLSRLFDADVTAISVVVHDVTERRQQEARRRQVTTMEAVRQLAGGLAHDFNNLLTTIMGRSQVVARTLSPSSPVRDDVLQIEQAAAGAARLSRDLLALARREPLEPERLELDALIRAAEPRIRQRVGAKMTCTVRLGASGIYAHVDRVRLVAGVLAVVQNAVEAMPDCGEISIETSRVLLPKHLGGSSEAACITVRDTGTGFAGDARAHLFEPFFSTKGDGRGLGLATTWAFAHQSGGSVDVESSTQGTTVRLLFPVATGSATAVAADARIAAPVLAIVPDHPTVARTVLLAEDEASVRRSVRIFLERAGFVVIEAADGVAALAAFEQAPDEIGLLLTDVMMPQMGGRELATRVLERRPDLPIVFMSGFLRDPEVLRMVNDRRVRFIAKPFDVDALVMTVRSELNVAGADVA